MPAKSGPPILKLARVGAVAAAFAVFNVIATEIVLVIMVGWLLPDSLMSGIVKFSMVFIPLSAAAMGLRAANREWTRHRRNTRRTGGQCVECGYDLRGNQSGVCPECGRSALSQTSL